MLDAYWTKGRPIPRISFSIDDLFTCGHPLDQEPFILSPETLQPREPERAPRLFQALLQADRSNLDDELPEDCDPKPLAIVTSRNKKQRSNLGIAIHALENNEGGFPVHTPTGDYRFSSKPDEKVPNSTINEVFEHPHGVKPLIKQGKVELESQRFDLRKSGEINAHYTTENMTLVHFHTSSNPDLFEQRIVMIASDPNPPQPYYQLPPAHDFDDDEPDDDEPDDNESEDDESEDYDNRDSDGVPEDDGSDGSDFNRRSEVMEEVYNPKAMSDNLRQGETLYLPPNWQLRGIIKPNDKAQGSARHGWGALVTWHFTPKVPLPTTQPDKGPETNVNAQVIS